MTVYRERRLFPEDINALWPRGATGSLTLLCDLLREVCIQLAQIQETLAAERERKEK